ncbi:MAG: type IV pilus secretin PilQ, partial [Methylophilaceae bacterium]|nr:type IV pilus secretin PilQ [Methylophilaceae bacterium]
MSRYYGMFGRLIVAWVLALGSPAWVGAADGPAPPNPPNAIESVDYSLLAGGKVAVRVTLKEALAQPPATFASNVPPRIAFDFMNVGNNLAKRSINVGSGGLLRSISAAQADNRTRLVLNLNAPSTYSSHMEGNSLVITLQSAASVGTADTVVTHFSQSGASTSKNVIKNVDFQRGKNGEGRVIVDLEEAGSAIDIRRQGKNLVVDFLNSSVADAMERRLNVTNFATPVITVDTFKQGANARMVIEPKGEWEHVAYQTDKRFIVEVKPIVFDPTKAVQGTRSGFGGEKLSLDFNGIDVKSLLRIIGDFTGKNIVVSDAVQGTITLRLKDVPWDQALDIILKQKGLGMENLGNTLVFAPKAEIAARQKENQDQENQLDEVKPLLTQAFQIKYQKAADIRALISDPKQPLLSKRGTSVVDPATNTLFVKDIDTSLAKIQDILNQIDIPARQVLIEARIVNADESFSKSLGAKFGVQKKTGIAGIGSTTSNAQAVSGKYKLGSSSGTGVMSGGDLGFSGKAANSDDTLNVNLPAKSTTGAAISAIAMTLFKLPAGFLLNLELSAAEADGKTKIISSPRVITANGTQASFDFGEEIPYQNATSSGATS